MKLQLASRDAASLSCSHTNGTAGESKRVAAGEAFPADETTMWVNAPQPPLRTSSPKGENDDSNCVPQTEDPSDTSTKLRPWQPILKGGLQAQVLETVRTIADGLQNWPPTPEHLAAGNPGLGSGIAGLAVFFAYLAEGLGEPVHEATANRLLKQTLALAEEQPMFPSLYDGLAGIGWAAEHLCDRLRWSDSEATLAEIDEALLLDLRQTQWPDLYGLTGGLVGMGVYALERLPSARAEECLECVIDHLVATAKHKPDGATWWRGPERMSLHGRKKPPTVCTKWDSVMACQGWWLCWPARVPPGSRWTVLALCWTMRPAGCWPRKRPTDRPKDFPTASAPTARSATGPARPGRTATRAWPSHCSAPHAVWVNRPGRRGACGGAAGNNPAPGPHTHIRRRSLYWCGGLGPPVQPTVSRNGRGASGRTVALLVRAHVGDGSPRRRHRRLCRLDA